MLALGGGLQMNRHSADDAGQLVLPDGDALGNQHARVDAACRGNAQVAILRGGGDN